MGTIQPLSLRMVTLDRFDLKYRLRWSKGYVCVGARAIGCTVRFAGSKTSMQSDIRKRSMRLTCEAKTTDEKMKGGVGRGTAIRPKSAATACSLSATRRIRWVWPHVSSPGLSDLRAGRSCRPPFFCAALFCGKRTDQALVNDMDTTHERKLDHLEESLIALRELALDLHEPMLVHLFEMALRQIDEINSSDD